MNDSSKATGVVAAFDGSAESAAALRWAAKEAQLHKDLLTIVTIVPRDFYYIQDSELQNRVYRWQHAHASQTLKEAEKVVESNSGDAAAPRRHTGLMFGKPAPTLIDLSKDARLIVVGRRGLGKVDRAIAGSVSSSVVRHAHCPVAVVPAGSEPWSPLPVLVGIDDSSACATAIELAFEEASRRNVPLVAVHVWFDVGYPVPEFNWHAEKHYAHEILDKHLAPWLHRYPHVKLTRRAAEGQPGKWLAQHSPQAQLVVVGSHGRGGFAGMLLGSVSRVVIECSKSPVLVARSS